MARSRSSRPGGRWRDVLQSPKRNKPRETEVFLHLTTCVVFLGKISMLLTEAVFAILVFILRAEGSGPQIQAQV